MRSFKAGQELETHFQPLANGAMSAVSSLLYISVCLLVFLVYVGDPDRTSQGLVPDKTGATEQSPSSAQPSAPAQGDQTISSRPDQQHPNISFKNEVMTPMGRWALRGGVQNTAKKGARFS